jgi:hypothetical protein
MACLPKGSTPKPTTPELRGWDEVTPSDDVEAADWIAPRLHGFAVDVGSVVPEGFGAYARIFHPAWWNEYPNRVPTEVRWSDVAAANGTVVHPEMQFHSISRTAFGGHSFSHGWNAQPRIGVLPAGQGAALAELLARNTTSPDVCWFCLWAGYGYGSMKSFSAAPIGEPVPPPMTQEQVRQTFGWPKPHQPSAPRVSLPGRDYVLYRGSVSSAAGWMDGPNIWWPDDRAWCVASEIDLPYTYVGGEQNLIDEILAHPAIESLPARLDHKITADGDKINA